MTRETFAITLTAEGAGAPGIIRLRRFLKSALRAYGLRCLEVREVAKTVTKAHQTHQEREEECGPLTVSDLGANAPACELEAVVGK